jgi:hypothetical protein
MIATLEKMGKGDLFTIWLYDEVETTRANLLRRLCRSRYNIIFEELHRHELEKKSIIQTNANTFFQGVYL